MADWAVFAGAGIGGLLILAWIGSDEKRRQWKRALRRRRCPHPHPCLDGTYRAREPGWAREVYYCPDCKHLWSRRISVPGDEWSRLSDAAPEQRLSG
jgi:hypothetical protein